MQTLCLSCQDWSQQYSHHRNQIFRQCRNFLWNSILELYTTCAIPTAHTLYLIPSTRVSTLFAIDLNHLWSLMDQDILSVSVYSFSFLRSICLYSDSQRSFFFVIWVSSCQEERHLNWRCRDSCILYHIQALLVEFLTIRQQTITQRSFNSWRNSNPQLT